MAGIEFEIERNIGIISEKSKGWTKELNLVSWNGRTPKFDIREWSPEHDSMGKGVTFSNEELKNLYSILKEFYGDCQKEDLQMDPKGNIDIDGIIDYAR